MTILYFSSTGNSLHVARSIAGDNGKLLALIDHHGASITDDCIGVVCPVVCGEIIPSVCRMIKSLRLRAPYIFGIVTYGYTPGHALKQLSQLLPGGSYFASVAMPDRCLTMRHPAKESARLASLGLEATLAAMRDDIINRHSRNATCSPLSYAIWKIGRWFRMGVVDHSDIHLDPGVCTRCGMCSRLCPAANITMSRASGGFPSIGTLCEGCLTCVNRCHAVALHCRGEKSHTHRYTYPSPKPTSLP